MKLYGGIDLHSNNSVVALLDDEDRAVYRKRLPNEAGAVLDASRALPGSDQGPGGGVHLQLVLASGRPDGCGLLGPLGQHVRDRAVQRAEVQRRRLRCGLVGQPLASGVAARGVFYPKAERPVRDLLRRRMRLVQQHTANVLSVQNLLARSRGRSRSANEVKRLTPEAVARLLPDPNLALAVQGNLLVMRAQEAAIDLLERQACAQVQLRPAYRRLLTVGGIGKILGLTIMLETRPVARFAKAGNYASYCRCVGGERLSNGKRKGQGNTKNGNKYLAWAYLEAAHFAVR